MLSPDDIERRRAAKRINESVKTVAAALNALFVALLAASLFLPAINGSLSLATPFWIILASVLHVMAHGVLGLIRSED